MTVRNVELIYECCPQNLMDRVMNEEVCIRAGIERELVSRAEQRVLGWFGHLKRMDEYGMARRVWTMEVS